MTVTNPTVKPSFTDKFSEAENTWNIEQLYTDLTEAKRRYRASQRQKITKTEKTHLRGLLCGYSPAEIAAELHRDCGGLRVDWSRGLYRYIETLTNQSLKDWKDIINLLAKYRHQSSYLTSLSTKIDYYEAVDAAVFYGREAELKLLKQWVVEDRCRIVAVRGMTGMGKTKLVSKFIQSLQTEFDYIIWRNISHAPPLIHILAELIDFLSDKQNKKLEDWRLINQSFKHFIRSNIILREGSSADTLAENHSFCYLEKQEFLIAEGIRVLMQCLQQNRCLIILDGWEALFQPQTLAGNYRIGYEGYGQLLQKIGKLKHQSCLILTTTEIPKVVTYSSGSYSPIKTLTLAGLGKSAELLLQDKELFDQGLYSNLIQQYSGNPQALKIVAEIIHHLFANRIAEFLAVNSNIFLGDFSESLTKQLDRLSNVELQTLAKLVKMKTPVSWTDLKTQFKPNEIIELIKVLESLERRSLISITPTQQDTFYQYNRLIRNYLNCVETTSQNELLTSGQQQRS
ncbi:MAG: ATP-binding protein [Microcoleaceae cyanobacterium]